MDKLKKADAYIEKNKVSSKEMFFFMGVILKIYRFTYSV